MAELCRRGDTPLVAAVISGRPASDGFADYIRPLAKEPAIKGRPPGAPRRRARPPGYCLRAERSSGASGCSASSA